MTTSDEARARDLAHRIVTDFRPEGWPAKEEEIARSLLAFASTSTPEGDWVMVPREPTEAMIEAARNYAPMPIDARLRLAWRDFLSAAPTPSAREGEGPKGWLLKRDGEPTEFEHAYEGEPWREPLSDADRNDGWRAEPLFASTPLPAPVETEEGDNLKTFYFSESQRELLVMALKDAGRGGLVDELEAVLYDLEAMA